MTNKPVKPAFVVIYFRLKPKRTLVICDSFIPPLNLASLNDSRGFDFQVCKSRYSELPTPACMCFSDLKTNKRDVRSTLMEIEAESNCIPSQFKRFSSIRLHAFVCERQVSGAFESFPLIWFLKQLL